MTTDDAGSAPDADADSTRLSSGTTEPAPPASTPPGAHRRPRRQAARAAWRRWRRSRPFWGGLLLVLSGLELLALPLTGVLVKGQIKLVIYIGIGGVFGVLIGILLIAAGIVLWVNPIHRVFYGIAGIVLGIVSFPASNLGGFVLGMLLAIIGGALAFAWVPAEPESVDADPVGRPGDDAAGHRTLAVVAMPALLVAGMLGTNSVANASAQPDGGCILGVICLPSPAPSPTPTGSTPSPTPTASSSSPSATASPSPTPSIGQSGTASPSATPTPSTSASASASPSGPSTSRAAKGKKAVQKDAAAPPAITASGAASVLTAGSVTLTDFQYVGNVPMPVSGGGTEEMMEFTASSASLTGDGMTLYATKLCGNLFGVLPICFTPSTVSAVLLSIANKLTAAVPVTMTDVTTDQPLTTAGTLQTGGLTIGF